MLEALSRLYGVGFRALGVCRVLPRAAGGVGRKCGYFFLYLPDRGLSSLVILVPNGVPRLFRIFFCMVF